MRDYKNQPSHYDITGFQSACAEFSEDQLSLDERFNIGDASVFSIRINDDYPSLWLNKGDELICNAALAPRYNDLVVLQDKVIRFKERAQLEDQEIRGVVIAQFHDPNSKEKKEHLLDAFEMQPKLI